MTFTVTLPTIKFNLVLEQEGVLRLNFRQDEQIEFPSEYLQGFSHLEGKRERMITTNVL